MSAEVARAIEQRLPGGCRSALVALVGSHAYGLARPDSDIDHRGVYVAEPEVALRVWGRPPDTVELAGEDTVAWELAHFARLAAAANPNVLEVLWASQWASAAGRLLLRGRQGFLSRQVFVTHVGFARGQIERAKRGSGGSRGKGHIRREKFLLHTARVVRQAGRILASPSDWSPRLPADEAAELRDLASRPLDYVERWFVREAAALERVRDASPLPERPDVVALNRLVLDARSASQGGETR